MQYTNNHKIPLPLAVFLATDHYDYVPNTFSATSLLKPIRQLVLAKRIESNENLVDISDLVSARMGTAIHTAIETIWEDAEKRNTALTMLGYSDDVINRIKVNPLTVKKGDIPVYMEIRSFKEVNSYTISGKFDFVAEGIVQDFKSTSTYSYLNQSNKDNYALQGSIYRFLNPDIIKKDEMIIHYIFTDWNKVESLKNENYPKTRTISQSIPLLSLEETENFIKNKLDEYSKYKDADEKDIPLCTDTELWRKPTVWKYYAKEDAVKATKNFDNPVQAYAYWEEKGRKGIVKEVKGLVSRCNYCPAALICSQKDSLIASGDLIYAN